MDHIIERVEKLEAALDAVHRRNVKLATDNAKLRTILEAAADRIDSVYSYELAIVAEDLSDEFREVLNDVEAH